MYLTPWPCSGVLPGRRCWGKPLGRKSRWGCWSSETHLRPLTRPPGCSLWCNQFLNHWLPVFGIFTGGKSYSVHSQILFPTSLSNFYWPLSYWANLALSWPRNWIFFYLSLATAGATAALSVLAFPARANICLPTQLRENRKKDRKATTMCWKDHVQMITMDS